MKKRRKSEADGGNGGADEEEFSSGSNASPEFNWLWSGEPLVVCRMVVVIEGKRPSTSNFIFRKRLRTARAGEGQSVWSGEEDSLQLDRP